MQKKKKKKMDRKIKRKNWTENSFPFNRILNKEASGQKKKRTRNVITVK